MFSEKHLNVFGKVRTCFFRWGNNYPLPERKGPGITL